MSDRLSIIDHDHEEPPRDTSKSPWGRAAVVLALLWAWLLYFFDVAWLQVGVGFMTGGVLMAWAIEYTGNKVPASWRRKPSSARRP